MRAEARADRLRARYARAIEHRFAERAARPLVLSPRDWVRISDWHDRGVPLALVLESIDAAFETRRRSRATPRSLAYIAALVEESWRTVLDGRRVRDTAGPAASSRPTPAAVWRERRDATPPAFPLARLLDRLLRAFEEGASPEALDAELDSHLEASSPADLVEAAARASGHTTARLRGRVPDDELARAGSVARIAWLRRRLGLPRLVSGAKR